MKSSTRKLLLCALFLAVPLCISSYSASNFYGGFSAKSSVTASNINDISSPSKDIVWLVGDSGTVKKTTNAASNGGTWSTPFSTAPTTSNILAVSAPSDNTSVAYILTSGAFYKTIDGGATFNGVDALSVSDLRDVFFTSASTGCAITLSRVYVTNNGGTIFNNVAVGTDLKKIFLIGTTGWLLDYDSGNNAIYQSLDGGASWNLKGTMAGLTINDIFFVDANTGFAVGNGVVLKSTNGGQSWTGVLTGSSVNFKSVSFINSNVGWIGGSNGTIMRTTNGGTTWVSQSTPTFRTTPTFNAIDAKSGSTYVWAGGTSGNLLYNNQPTITSVTPSVIQKSETATVSQTLAIAGSYLQDGGTILITADGFSISSQTITASTGGTADTSILTTAATGLVTVAFVNPDGSSISYANAFTISPPPTTTTTNDSGTPVTTTTPAPAISQISPAYLTQGASTAVTITGNYFQTGATIAISGAGVTASTPTVVSATEMTTTLTAASGADVGSRTLTITNPDGQAESGTITVLSATTTSTSLAISKAVPASARLGETINVTLTISNIPSGYSSATVNFYDPGIASSQVGASQMTDIPAQIVSATEIVVPVTLAQTNIRLGLHDVSVNVKDASGAILDVAVKTNAFTVAQAETKTADVISTKNPVRTGEPITLQIRAPSAGSYRILFGGAGGLAYDAMHTFATAGYHNVTINRSHLSWGIYKAVVVKDGSISGTVKVMVMN